MDEIADLNNVDIYYQLSKNVNVISRIKGGYAIISDIKKYTAFKEEFQEALSKHENPKTLLVFYEIVGYTGLLMKDFTVKYVDTLYRIEIMHKSSIRNEDSHLVKYIRKYRIKNIFE